MAANDTFNPGREQVQVTASPNLMSERARFDPNGSVDKLLQALGSDSTQRELANFQQQYEHRKLQDQQAKFDWYVEQFAQDHAGGAVSQAQVKQRFPETVPIIAARIAESIGHREGQKQFQSVIDEISGNDALRLDSTARAAFIAQKRKEITDGIPQGNDFYGAGVVQSMDKLLAQHEINWQTETAAYHQKVQTDQFSAEVVDALNSDPKKLLDVDAKWGASSSLNNIERNKIVVSTAIDTAFNNDDVNVLTSVPDRFLNADAKAHLERARVQLVDRRMTDFRNAQYLKTVQREEQLRSMKTNMVMDVASGRPIDPAAYAQDSEAFQFALQMREAPRIDESTSQANASAFENSILDSASKGPTASLQQLTDAVLANPGLNPKDKQALISKLPKVIEGRNLMRDDDVRQPFQDVLGPALHALETSTNATIQALLTGRNLRAEVVKTYDNDVRRLFKAEYEETGQWPKGHRKIELIDRAVERATKRLEDATKIAGGSGSPKPSAAPTPAPKPSPQAAASTGLPKGVTRIQ